MEPHDAAIAKYARGAPKDLQWIRAGIDAGILSIATLEYRFRETVFADDPERERVREAIAREVVGKTAVPGLGNLRNDTEALAPVGKKED